MNFDMLRYLSLLDNYVIMKRSDVFPNISVGSDIDILVEDREYAEQIFIKHFLQEDVDIYAIQVDQREAHTHIDILMDNVLILRFDLIDSFEFLNRIHVKHGFCAHILTNKTSECLDGKAIFFPAPLDDMLIRYLEYIEYFEALPIKEKHMEYVLEHAEAASWPEFIAHVHRFTKLVHDSYLENPNKKVAWRARIGLRQCLEHVIRRLPPAVKHPLQSVYHLLTGRS